MATPFPFQSGQTLLASQLNAITTLPSTTKIASHTLVIADQGTRVIMNVATPNTVTVNTSIFGAGDIVEIQNIGAGVATVTAGTATVVSAGPLAIPQNGGGRLVFSSASAATYFPTAATASASGLTFITGATFTTVASVSLPAATFSATYTCYRVIFVGTAVSTTLSYSMRMRIAGADNTASNYSSGVKGVTNNALDISFSSDNQSSWNLGASDVGTQPMSVSFDIGDPFATSKTRVFGSGQFNATGGAGGAVFGAFHNTTTSFDSLSLIASTGTISGFYRIYGYAES